MAQPRIERMLNEVRNTSYETITVLTIAAAAAAMIIVGTSMTSGELTAAGTAPAQNGNTAPSLQTDNSSTYFPPQHVNQATETSEHIQAF